MIGYIIFPVLAIILAIGISQVLGKPVWSATIAALALTIGFQIFAALQLGYMDPFWPIAVIVMLVITTPAALVGVYLWRYATRRPSA